MNVFNSNSNYPPGVSDDTPGAPWNESYNKPVDVDVCVSTTLSKSTTIKTTDYIAEAWEDCERDEEGYVTHIGGTDYDFSECDFRKDYENSEWTLPDLLTLLEQYLLEDYRHAQTPRKKVIENQLKSLRGWTVDELEVMQDE